MLYLRIAVALCLWSVVLGAEESCFFQWKHPKITTLISAGEVYTLEGACAYFYCEPAALSKTGLPTIRQFPTGCLYKDRCLEKDETFYDDACYKKKCVFTEHDDGDITSKIQFLSTTKTSCLAADGTCMPRGSKFFPCFYHDEYSSHCACVRSGRIAYLKNLLPYSAERIGTRGGTADGEFCYFPFRFAGGETESCIRGRGGSWCATTPHFQKDGKWGFCVDSPSYRFTKDGYRCTLPFRYNGTLHHDCTSLDARRPWCGKTFHVKSTNDRDYCETD